MVGCHSVVASSDDDVVAFSGDSILDTQDEKASLSNWFDGVMCEIFSQNAYLRLDLCYGVFEIFLNQKPKSFCVVSFFCNSYGCRKSPAFFISRGSKTAACQ